MNKRLNVLVKLVGAVIVLSIAMASVGMAADDTTATQSISVRDLFLSNLAKYQDKEGYDQKAAVTAARFDTINQLADEGKITPEQRDAMLNGEGGCACGCEGECDGTSCMCGEGMMGGHGMMRGKGMMGMMGGHGMMCPMNQ